MSSFDSGCGYQLIFVETLKYKATAAFLADVTIIKARYLLMQGNMYVE